MAWLCMEVRQNFFGMTPQKNISHTLKKILCEFYVNSM